MPYGRPESDLAVGDWTSTPLYPNLDEQAADDGDFVSSGDEPEYDFFTVKLNTLPRPVKGLHTLRVRLRRQGATPLPTGIHLLQGNTIIAAWTVTPDTSFDTAEFTLTEAQIRLISDYTDLSVRVIANEVIRVPCCEEPIPGSLTATIETSSGNCPIQTVQLTLDPLQNAWKTYEDYCGIFSHFSHTMLLFCGGDERWFLATPANPSQPHDEDGGSANCDPFELLFRLIAFPNGAIGDVTITH